VKPKYGSKQEKNILLGNLNYLIGGTKLKEISTKELDVKLKTITVGVATTCDTKVLTSLKDEKGRYYAYTGDEVTLKMQVIKKM
jgi:hypothetical protein